MPDNGLLVANLISSDSGFRRCVRSIRAVFDDAVVLAPAEASPENVIVFVWEKLAAGLSLDESLAGARVLPLNLCETAIRIEYGKSINWDERTPDART